MVQITIQYIKQKITRCNKKGQLSQNNIEFFIHFFQSSNHLGLVFQRNFLQKTMKQTKNSIILYEFVTFEVNETFLLNGYSKKMYNSQKRKQYSKFLIPLSKFLFRLTQFSSLLWWKTYLYLDLLLNKTEKTFSYSCRRGLLR